MTREEKIALTPEQEKAFKSFQRAYKKCKASGIEFYTVLERITALNGEYLVRVHDEPEKNDLSTNDINNPTIFDAGFGGWADDAHFIEVKE
ncbi:MAG: hypothetical protein GY710_06305 [Desulfobacteraceae bacterium]|nr:hypothetical protein [Desulfobacteraceae bacterium]